MGSVKEDVSEHASALYQTVADEVKNWFSLLKEIWPLVALLLAGLGILLWLAKPAPPTKVMMATGTGGSYRVLGEKYQAFFKQKGIHLELVETHGSLENLQHLIDRKDPIQAAFVQGGTISSEEVNGVLSLGSVDYEPVWIFYRSKAFDEAQKILDRDIIKLKMGVGPMGSGTHLQAMNILKLNGLPTDSPNLKALSNIEGVQALEKGELDALILVDGFNSPSVQRLILNPEIRLANFKRADAYTRLMTYFEELTVPMGGFDLENNIPAKSIDLISTTTNLLIDDRLHPAIQLLFLEAAKEINGVKSYFSKAGEFPAYRNNEIPLSNEARYFYQKGTPALMKYLPFWLAEFIERMFLLLVPFAAFAYPIIKAIPNYRVNLARKQINSVYKELEKFEQAIIQNFDINCREDYIETLNEMERKIIDSKASKLVTADCYTLRNNIDFIRHAIANQTIYLGKEA